MLLYTCASCGGRTVSFESSPEIECPGCGETTAAHSGLRITISLGHEDFPELGDQQVALREDTVSV